MSVTPEELMALVDGELAPEEAARVEAEIAGEPLLARRLEAERKLRASLRAHLDPVLAEPVPDPLGALIARAAAEDSESAMTDAPRSAPAQVVDLAAARSRREEANKAKERAAKGPRVPFFADRRMAFAMAASLVLGVMLGTGLHSEGPITQTPSGLAARGPLARQLDRQLAASGDAGGLRILASFRRQGGDYCRVFAGTATSGIACREDGTWMLERTVAGGAAQTGQYRQAGSADASLMATAQDMMSGNPLDAQEERAAVEKGWR